MNNEKLRQRINKIQVGEYENGEPYYLVSDEPAVEAIMTLFATQNTALLNRLIDEEVQLYKTFDDDSKICVGIKLMADKVRGKYDE